MKKEAWLAVLFTLGMILGGCTATYTMHYPGKHNAIDRNETRTYYFADEPRSP